MDFSKLIQSWQNEYYTDLVLFIIELSTLVICLKHSRKSIIGKLFILYLSIDIFFVLLHYILYIQKNISYNKFTFYSISNVIISIIELFVYYNFFYRILNNRVFKTLSPIIVLTYTVLALIYITTRFEFFSNRISYNSFLLTSLEFALLIPPCILYYREIFNNFNPLPLTKRPSFWIITGIFFYTLISIPYFLLTVYFSESNLKYMGILNSLLFNFPFAVNFIFISKAVLCRKPLTI